mgnify:CR=1 FL=1|jgi:hypothetical protein
MAVSDYNGKEKASLNNIKEMIENGASLQQIRGAMGLGYSLDALAAANGGTGVTTLQDVADVIAEAISNLRVPEYSGYGAVVVFKDDEQTSGTEVFPGVVVSKSSGFSFESNKLIVASAGLYRVAYTIEAALKHGDIAGIHGSPGSSTYLSIDNVKVASCDTGYVNSNQSTIKVTKESSFDAYLNANSELSISKYVYDSFGNIEVNRGDGSGFISVIKLN